MKETEEMSNKEVIEFLLKRVPKKWRRYRHLERSLNEGS
jgi:hypothetical protein